jgi:hypothetical protein|tara:strand:- start:1310 stop:1615 length:306 start_codon:yes stop_codon:yes gene_type:complete
VEIYKLEEIFQITLSCYLRTRSLFEECLKYDDDIIEHICSFFVSLKHLVEYLEDLLYDPTFADRFHKKIMDADILAEVHTLIAISSVHEEKLSFHLSTNVH